MFKLIDLVLYDIFYEKSNPSSFCRKTSRTIPIESKDVYSVAVIVPSSR